MSKREYQRQQKGTIGLLLIIIVLGSALYNRDDLPVLSNFSARDASVDQSQYRAWISEEAAQNNLNKEEEEALSRVAACESSWNPLAVNPVAVWKGEHAEGLFQYIPSTWARTPQGANGDSIWDPHAQIRATAWAWAHGWRNQWACQ